VEDAMVKDAKMQQKQASIRNEDGEQMKEEGPAWTGC
jgi:hypothetical protein